MRHYSKERKRRMSETLRKHRMGFYKYTRTYRNGMWGYHFTSRQINRSGYTTRYNTIVDNVIYTPVIFTE